MFIARKVLWFVSWFGAALGRCELAVERCLDVLDEAVAAAGPAPVEVRLIQDGG